MNVISTHRLSNSGEGEALNKGADQISTSELVLNIHEKAREKIGRDLSQVEQQQVEIIGLGTPEDIIKFIENSSIFTPAAVQMILDTGNEEYIALMEKELGENFRTTH